MDAAAERISAWLTAMTTEEQCTLLGGASSWRTHAVDRVGVPAIKMSDGPNGVRGEGDGSKRTPGVLIPVGIAMGASWDPDLVGRLGDLLGREAVRKGAHVLLGPTVNLHRTPIGGRTFEAFSEDPELTAALAVAWVRGVQAHDVAVAVKHLVVNDTEVDRLSVDVAIDERTLRELYLRPFEACVIDGGAWGVMTAYNQLGGEFCAANHRLLHQILREEWGFDGFVVSDWFGAHDAVASANGGLTIEMPGPARIYGTPLARAVAEGHVDRDVVSALAREVLVLAERTRAGERSANRVEQSVDDPTERALCREAAIAGTVLLRNVAGALPLDLGSLASIAVVGPNAAESRAMGGGSSALQPLAMQSILEAVRVAADAADVVVVHEPGVRIDRRTPIPPPATLVGPDGTPGLEVTFSNGTDPDGDVVVVQRSQTTMLRYLGSAPPGVNPNQFRLRVAGAFIPEVDGMHEVGVIVTGAATVSVATTVVIDDPDRLLPRSDAFYGVGSVEVVAQLELTASTPIAVTVDMQVDHGFGGLRIGVRRPQPMDLFERAIAAAATADAAIVVVGTNDEWETEGNDRTSIALPGDQDELVRRVAAVNARTVVVVNAGAPVAMPWADDVAAILLPFFGGLELGPAVADVLTGIADPGGRLPTTYPKRLEDSPSWPHYAPVGGRQTYGEGMHMGYRGFDAAGIEPLFPFGHGLSYGEAVWHDARCDVDTITVAALTGGASVVVRTSVEGLGDRPTTVVMQGYVAAIDPPVVRPPKELKAFAKHIVQPGATTEAVLAFGVVAFRRWSPDTGAWIVDPGTYDLVITPSAGTPGQRVRIEITAP